MEELEISYTSTDDYYMQEAIREARLAAELMEVPVGAVVVKDGEIISRAHNLVETRRSSSAHAELLAIEAAEQALGAKWLSGCTLYVTLEPCPMCAGAMVLARLDRLCYGAADPKNGACESLFNITQCEGLNHRVDVVARIREEECGRLLSDFFRQRRADKAALKKKAQAII